MTPGDTIDVDASYAERPQVLPLAFEPSWFERLRFRYLRERHNAVRMQALFSLINGLISIGILAAVALLTAEPFLFPSLGATAFLQFQSPLTPAASPRNTLTAHFVGGAVGMACLAAFGLQEHPAANVEGVSDARVLAAAASLGLTSAILVLRDVPHAPAGATTLIVSLGILHETWHLAVLMAAVLLLTAQAFVINRLAGIPYPLWHPRES